MIKIKKLENDEYTLIEFELDGSIEPGDLKGLEPGQVDGSKGVVISGRGPIWLYGYLIHYYHPTRFVAVNDPRVGYVIVESHCKEYNHGDILSYKLIEKEVDK